MNFFAYLYRMRYIRRWSLMRCGTPENVSEHSHDTAMIAHALGVINNTVFGGDADADRLAVCAVFHEASEVLTGDLPTPVKYYNPEIRTAYKDIEAIAGDKLLGMLPEPMRAVYAPVLRADLPPYEKRLLKAADKLEALVKCVEECKCGNREFASARSSIRAELDSFDLPEVRYFLDTFLSGFELTLDEMGE